MNVKYDDNRIFTNSFNHRDPITRDATDEWAVSIQLINLAYEVFTIAKTHDTNSEISYGLNGANN